MYADIINKNLFIREFLNGGTFPLSLFLAIVIGIHLWNTYREFGSGWSKQEGTQTACALFWVFFAESLRAGLVWWTLRSVNDGQRLPPDIELVFNIGLTFAGLALVIMLLRCSYLFTPPKWGNKVWIASVSITTLFLILSHLIGEMHHGI